MPGRAWEYTNQNLGLVQSGFDRLGGLANAIQAERERQRQLEEQNRPASPVEQFIGGRIMEIINQGRKMMEQGMEPREAAIRTKLAILQEQQGGNAYTVEVIPPTPKTVQLPALEGGMAGPREIQAMPVDPNTMQVERPTKTIDLSGMVASSSLSNPVPLSPPAAPTAPPAPPALPPIKPALPPVKTARDYQSVLSGAESYARLQPRPPGLSLEDRLALISAKGEQDRQTAGVKHGGRMEEIGAQQAGAKERAAMRAQTLMEIAKLHEQNQNFRFLQSTHEINNALRLIQQRYALLDRIVNARTEHSMEAAKLRAELDVLNITTRQVGDTLQALATGMMMPGTPEHDEAMQIVKEGPAAIYEALQRLDAQIRAMGGRQGQPGPKAQGPFPQPQTSVPPTAPQSSYSSQSNYSSGTFTPGVPPEKNYSGGP